MAPTAAQVAENPDDLLTDPIAWFFAEHQRHRQFCDLMQRTSLASLYDEKALLWLLDFVVNELPMHVLDEERDLFPLLRARAEPEDNIDQVLDRLSDEHGKDLDRATAVRRYLEACLRMEVPIKRSYMRRRALEAFAIQERSHLALENAVVLPIARLRLSESDLAKLSRGLAARRGMVRRVSKRPEVARAARR
jgi:hemerythrin-like domain-containing protein